jgi:hypothetical protein
MGAGFESIGREQICYGIFGIFMMVTVCESIDKSSNSSRVVVLFTHGEENRNILQILS